jgi:hypothetical protein
VNLQTLNKHRITLQFQKPKQFESSQYNAQNSPRISLLIGGAETSEELNLFESNNAEEYFHLPIVSLQRSNVVDPEEYLLCLESSLSHLQFGLWVRLQLRSNDRILRGKSIDTANAEKMSEDNHRFPLVILGD